jgi:hypothetical protein
VLGPPKPRRLADPIAASLEDLVPLGHFYRHLEAKLDLDFVRAWARELYAERGRPSIDPVVFFKLQLVMVFDGIRSECQPSRPPVSISPVDRNRPESHTGTPPVTPSPARR